MAGEWAPPQEWRGRPFTIGFEHPGSWRVEMGGGVLLGYSNWPYYLYMTLGMLRVGIRIPYVRVFPK